MHFLGAWPVLQAGERRQTPELMDQPGLDPIEHGRALRGLGRINRVSRSAAVYWPLIRRLAESHPARPTTVLDLASGGGDVPVALANRAIRAGLDVRIDGCDMSPTATQFAAQRARDQGVDVRFFTMDVLGDDLPTG